MVVREGWVRNSAYLVIESSMPSALMLSVPTKRTASMTKKRKRKRKMEKEREEQRERRKKSN